MKHGSLFSGIGGFDLAAEWMGWENVFQVEWDEYCQKVLRKNFPNTNIYGDIKEFDGTKHRGAIDIISGGPPCQPTSRAGKRKGKKDDRWLWPDTLRVLREIRPRIAVFENPDDILTIHDGEAFEEIWGEMENQGYKVWPVGIPACCVGAWQRRNRIFIIAYNDNIPYTGGVVNRGNHKKAKGGKGANQSKGEESFSKRIRAESFTSDKATANTYPSGLPITASAWQYRFRESKETSPWSTLDRTITKGWLYWETEPGVERMVHGVPHRVDRIKALGNAIVPQVALEIFKAIESIKPPSKFYK